MVYDQHRIPGRQTPPEGVTCTNNSRPEWCWNQGSDKWECGVNVSGPVALFSQECESFVNYPTIKVAGMEIMVRKAVPYFPYSNDSRIMQENYKNISTYKQTC